MENWYKDLIKDNVFDDVISNINYDEIISKKVNYIFDYTYKVGFYKRKFDCVSFITPDKFKKFLKKYINEKITVIDSLNFKLNIGSSNDIIFLINNYNFSNIFQENDYMDICCEDDDIEDGIYKFLYMNYNLESKINKFLYIGYNLDLDVSEFKHNNYSYVLLHYDKQIDMFVIFNNTYNEVNNKKVDLSYPKFSSNMNKKNITEYDSLDVIVDKLSVTHNNPKKNILSRFHELFQ